MSEDSIRELDVIASLLSTLAKLDLAGEGTDESPTKNALMRESINEWRTNSLPLTAALHNYKARINMARKLSKTPEWSKASKEILNDLEISKGRLEEAFQVFSGRILAIEGEGSTEGLS